MRALSSSFSKSSPVARRKKSCFSFLFLRCESSPKSPHFVYQGRKKSKKIKEGKGDFREGNLAKSRANRFKNLIVRSSRVLGLGAMTLDYRERLQNEALRFVTYNVNFASRKFPNYKIRADSVIVEPNRGPEAPSLKEIVAKETIELLERRQRLSVRDLAKKFEKGLNTATKLSNEAKLREVTDRHVLLKKLMVVLESLKGHMMGQNKDEVEEAISMVETLAVQLSQREGELLQEKSEVKKLAIFLKKASEDAKKVVEEERACARVEIESSRAVVRRVVQAFHEHEMKTRSTEKQKDFQELMREVQEARRIKMLHQPSRVMHMEHELQALRIQYAEKSLSSVQLRKESARDPDFLDVLSVNQTPKLLLLTKGL